MLRAGPKSNAARPSRAARKPPGVRLHDGTAICASGRPPPRWAVMFKAPPPDWPASAANRGVSAALSVSSPPLFGRAVIGRVRVSSVPALPAASLTLGASRAKAPSARFNSAISGRSSRLGAPSPGHAARPAERAPITVTWVTPSRTRSRSSRPCAWLRLRSPETSRPALRARGPCTSKAASRPPAVRPLDDKTAWVSRVPAADPLSRRMAAGEATRHSSPRCPRFTMTSARFRLMSAPRASMPWPARPCALMRAWPLPRIWKASIQPWVWPSKSRAASALRPSIPPVFKASAVRWAAMTARPSPRRALRSG
ncbi:hypothetical protein D3C80_841900 [compost metagenome]